jgi:hypothetical protein
VVFSGYPGFLHQYDCHDILVIEILLKVASQKGGTSGAGTACPSGAPVFPKEMIKI